MGSTPSIDLQDAAIRGKLKDIKTLTDPIENGGQNMDINEQDEELGYSALTEAIKSMHIVGSKKKMIKMYEFDPIDISIYCSLLIIKRRHSYV